MSGQIGGSASQGRENPHHAQSCSSLQGLPLLPCLHLERKAPWRGDLGMRPALMKALLNRAPVGAAQEWSTPPARGLLLALPGGTI